MTDQPVSASGAVVTEERAITRLNEFCGGDRGPYTGLPSDLKTVIAALAQRDEEVARLKGERDKALEDADAAEVREQEAYAVDWPKWAAEILKDLRRVGFEYEHDEEIDLPADFVSHVNEWVGSIEREWKSRALAAEARLAQANEALTDAKAVIESRSGGQYNNGRVGWEQQAYEKVCAALSPSPTPRAQSAGEEVDKALVYLDKLIGDSRSTITQGNLETVAALIRKQASALAEAKEALSSAPIPSKYHGQRGFELERFLADYETFVRNKLRSLTQEPSSAG
jgi:hypothetical protein